MRSLSLVLESKFIYLWENVSGVCEREKFLHATTFFGCFTTARAGFVCVSVCDVIIKKQS